MRERENGATAHDEVIQQLDIDERKRVAQHARELAIGRAAPEG